MILPCGCPSNFPSWHEQDVDLSGQPMLSLGIPMLLHMPLAYEAYLKKQQEEVMRLELPERWPGFVLTRTGFLRGRIVRLLENGESPSHNVSFLPRPFQLYAVVHQGDVGTMRNVVRDVQMKLLEGGRMPKELYLSYLTCPQCEAQRGGTKVMILRRWEESARLKRARRPAAAE